MKIKLKVNSLIFFKKINKEITLIHEDIVVAIGIIKNPTSSKKTTLIIIFSKTEIKEI